MAEAGVVEDDIDVSERTCSLGEGVNYVFRLRDVEGQDEEAILGVFFDESVQASRSTSRSDNDVAPLQSYFYHRAAYSRGSACDCKGDQATYGKMNVDRAAYLTRPCYSSQTLQLRGCGVQER